MGDLHPIIPPRVCSRALVLFTAGTSEPRDPDLYEIVRTLHLAMRAGAEVAWGVHRDPAVEDELQVLLLLARAIQKVEVVARVSRIALPGPLGGAH